MRFVPPAFRHALFMLSRSPGFALAAVLALAFGIGANTSIYSMADVLIYRPLPLPDLDHTVIVVGTAKSNTKAFDRVSPADFLDYRRDATSIEHLSAAREASLNLTGDGEPERVSASRVTSGFFAGLGAAPLLGRTFLDNEDAPGQGMVAILSYGLWAGRFASDGGILNRSVRLDGRLYRVVGVMPRDFSYPPTTEVWIPAAMDAGERANRSAGVFNVVGHLKPGITIEQSHAELTSLAERISERFPESHKNSTVRVELLREYVSGNLVADYMRMLLGCVAFVLLIACSNVANLQFARVTMRSKEMAIRSALGASRLRLLGQFLIESSLLGVLGGVFGLLLAKWGLYLMRPALPPEVQQWLPGWSHLGINSHVLLFTLAVAIFAGIAAGIVPAWLGSRTDLNETLKESGRGTSSGVRRHRIRSALVVSQMVLALVLLVGAGLIAKGSRLVTDPAPNLDPGKALALRISLPGSRYSQPSEMRAFEDRLVRSLQPLPGVVSAGLVSYLPYSGSFSTASITIEGRDERDFRSTPSALNQRVSVDYFRTLHLAMRSGRGFTESDGPDGPRVAIISQGFARQYFPGLDPIGKRVRIGFANEHFDWLTIVGVVSDMRQNPFDKNYRPALYRPMAQATIGDFDVLIRTTGDPNALKGAVRDQIAAIDRDQPLYQFKTLDRLFDEQLSGFRFLSVLMDVFGFVALFLSSVGVYAVMAHSVNERTHEIGVRMALGARQGDVLWLIVRRGCVLALIGIAIGLPATLAIAKLVANVMFGVNEHDPATFAIGLGVLASAAILASYVPARRAARVDPVVTLRTE